MTKTSRPIQEKESHPFSFTQKTGEVKTPTNTYEIDLEESMEYLIWKSEKYSFFKHVENLTFIKDTLLECKLPDNVGLPEFQNYINSLTVVHEFLNFLFIKKESRE